MELSVRTVLKPLGGVTGVFVSSVLSFILLNPFQNQFSCLPQNTSPQNEIRDWNKIPENFVNGVQDRMGLFITSPTSNL